MQLKAVNAQMRHLAADEAVIEVSSAMSHQKLLLTDMPMCSYMRPNAEEQGE